MAAELWHKILDTAIIQPAVSKLVLKCDNWTLSMQIFLTTDINENYTLKGEPA